MISQLDPHVLQVADIILISRVGPDDVRWLHEISVWSCCGEFWSRCPPEGPPRHVAPSAVNQLLHWPRCRGTQDVETSAQPAFMQPQGYMDNRIWRTYKINQYHLSLEYFRGPWKGRSAYFFCIYCSCDSTGRVQDPKPTETCNLEIYRLLLICLFMWEQRAFSQLRLITPRSAVTQDHNYTLKFNYEG